MRMAKKILAPRSPRVCKDLTLLNGAEMYVLSAASSLPAARTDRDLDGGSKIDQWIDSFLEAPGSMAQILFFFLVKSTLQQHRSHFQVYAVPMMLSCNARDSASMFRTVKLKAR